MPKSLKSITVRSCPDSGSLSGGGHLSKKLEAVFCSRPIFGTLVKSILKPEEAVDAKELFAWILERVKELLGMGDSHTDGSAALALMSTRLSMLSLDSADVESLVAEKIATLLAVSIEAGNVLYAE